MANIIDSSFIFTDYDRANFGSAAGKSLFDGIVPFVLDIPVLHECTLELDNIFKWYYQYGNAGIETRPDQDVGQARRSSLASYGPSFASLGKLCQYFNGMIALQKQLKTFPDQIIDVTDLVTNPYPNEPNSDPVFSDELFLTTPKSEFSIADAQPGGALDLTALKSMYNAVRLLSDGIRAAVPGTDWIRSSNYGIYQQNVNNSYDVPAYGHLGGKDCVFAQWESLSSDRNVLHALSQWNQGYAVIAGYSEGCEMASGSGMQFYTSLSTQIALSPSWQPRMKYAAEGRSLVSVSWLQLNMPYYWQVNRFSAVGSSNVGIVTALGTKYFSVALPYSPWQSTGSYVTPQLPNTGNTNFLRSIANAYGSAPSTIQVSNPSTEGTPVYKICRIKIHQSYLGLRVRPYFTYSAQNASPLLPQ